MNIFPTCKINLGLHVLEKRSDGFHNLETVMVEIPWTDTISYSENENDFLELDGLAIEGNDNLVMKALDLARSHASIPPLRIALTKNIPMGAGLGGGSSDAAFFYKSLASTYFPDRKQADLEKDISTIGSDCAFFINGGTQHCTGRGEILKPIAVDLKGKSLVIINPGIHISTAEAFSKIIPNANRKSIIDILTSTEENWKTELKNDFELSAFELYPKLASIKNSLYEQGAMYASMSGSGSTMFGLFNDAKEASIVRIEESKFHKLISL